MPPLAFAPAIRLSISGKNSGTTDWGIRTFYAYSGSTAPTSTDLTAINTEAGSAWTSDVAPIMGSNITATTFTSLDLTSATGAEVTSAGSIAGTRSGTGVEAALAAVVAYGIARHYRGGHPRVYLPAGVTTDVVDPANWNTTFATAVTAAWTNFLAAVAGTTGLSCGSLTHVNISYYHGFNTVGPYPDGKFKYPPKPRTSALLDNVTSSVCAVKIGSQKRRRTALTP